LGGEESILGESYNRDFARIKKIEYDLNIQTKKEKFLSLLKSYKSDRDNAISEHIINNGELKGLTTSLPLVNKIIVESIDEGERDEALFYNYQIDDSEFKFGPPIKLTDIQAAYKHSLTLEQKILDGDRINAIIITEAIDQSKITQSDVDQCVIS